jgi:hypothetical protein
MRIVRIIMAVMVAFGVQAIMAASPGQQRMQAARELQAMFDRSLVKGFEIKFVVRGGRCDVLHVEGYTNLTRDMMSALANGTLIYGRVLAGGVNQFAFGQSFRGVAYSNAEDRTYMFFGEPTLTRSQVKRMRRCTDTMAEKLSGSDPVVRAPAPPPYEPLSWPTARVGTKLYNGAYKHDATIVHVKRGEGLIEVRYVKSGSVEPKLLSAVAHYWYVRK